MLAARVTASPKAPSWHLPPRLNNLLAALPPEVQGRLFPELELEPLVLAQ